MSQLELSLSRSKPEDGLPSRGKKASGKGAKTKNAPIRVVELFAPNPKLIEVVRR